MIERCLAAAWPGVQLAAEPAPLTGGFWAAMHRLRVSGQPDGVPADLVLRVAPDATMAAKETAVQRVLADAGYPTPAVRLAGPATDGLGGAWVVMDLATGTSPLDGLDGAAALLRAPGLYRDLPRILATSMARLHAVDAEPVSDAVATEAPAAAWSVGALLGHFEAGATALANTELLRSVRVVADRRPSEGATVVCHGDLHPFNILADGERITVLDWTASIRAEPAYDVAFTSFLIAHPPLHAAGPLGAVVAAVGRSLSRRFVTAYQRAARRDVSDSIEWYRALHGLRVLLESESIGPDRADHPLNALRPAARRAVAAVAVEPTTT